MSFLKCNWNCFFRMNFLVKESFLYKHFENSFANVNVSLHSFWLLFSLKQKNKKAFAKPVGKKKQPTVDHITGDKIPKSFVFSRGKLPGPLKQLELDLRKLMLPYTALKLKVKLYFFSDFDFTSLCLLLVYLSLFR